MPQYTSAETLCNSKNRNESQDHSNKMIRQKKIQYNFSVIYNYMAYVGSDGQKKVNDGISFSKMYFIHSSFFICYGI